MFIIHGQENLKLTDVKNLEAIVSSIDGKIYGQAQGQIGLQFSALHSARESFEIQRKEAMVKQGILENNQQTPNLDHFSDFNEKPENADFVKQEARLDTLNSNLLRVQDYLRQEAKMPNAMKFRN